MTERDGAPPLRFNAYLCAQGFDAVLDRELAPVARNSPRTPRWPSVVTRALDDDAAHDRAHQAAAHDFIFARQVLPRARLCHGDSINQLAEAAYRDVVDVLGDAEAPNPILLHVFVPHPELFSSLRGRADLLAQAFTAILRARKRSMFRRVLVDPPSTRTLDASVHVVQLALVGRSSLMVSVASPRARAFGGWDLAPWPAGIAPVAEDKTAPSRAYGKFEEALAWLGRAPAPGERVVDLGGSPGGWSWKALARGALVTAVDRARLAPPALGHPNLTMVIGNALSWQPPAPVDWLICDVICEPARSIEILERWAARGHARHFVVTIKFKGHDGYDVLRDLPARLARHGLAFVRIKQLHRNRNEVEVIAARDGVTRGDPADNVG